MKWLFEKGLLLIYDTIISAMTTKIKTGDPLKAYGRWNREASLHAFRGMFQTI